MESQTWLRSGKERFIINTSLLREKKKNRSLTREVSNLKKTNNRLQAQMETLKNTNTKLLDDSNTLRAQAQMLLHGTITTDLYELASLKAENKKLKLEISIATKTLNSEIERFNAANSLCSLKWQ